MDIETFRAEVTRQFPDDDIAVESNGNAVKFTRVQGGKSYHMSMDPTKGAVADVVKAAVTFIRLKQNMLAAAAG